MSIQVISSSSSIVIFSLLSASASLSHWSLYFHYHWQSSIRFLMICEHSVNLYIFCSVLTFVRNVFLFLSCPWMRLPEFGSVKTTSCWNWAKTINSIECTWSKTTPALSILSNRLSAIDNACHSLSRNGPTAQAKYQENATPFVTVFSGTISSGAVDLFSEVAWRMLMIESSISRSFQRDYLICDMRMRLENHKRMFPVKPCCVPCRGKLRKSLQNPPPLL